MCSNDSDCSVALGYSAGSRCIEVGYTKTCADAETANAVDDAEDAVKGWLIAVIIICVLIFIGIVACIVCCVCGAAWCCKKAMKEDKEGG